MSINPTGEVTTSPTVTGSFTGSSVLVNVEKITAVDLRVSAIGPNKGGVATQDGCRVASGGACDAAQISFTWRIPRLAYNGPYVVEAVGKYCDPLLCLNPSSASVSPIEFRLAAEPEAPGDLRVEPGPDRSVVVSWARNTEPDLLYYALFRKDPGGEFRRLGNDIEPSESERRTFADTSVAGTNGGDFVYRVFAVRNGASGDSTTTKISPASGDKATTVVAPPTTLIAPGANPGEPSAPAPGQGADISSFLSGQAPELPAPDPIYLDLPDTGFGELLPFGGLPDEAEPGEEDAVLPGSPQQRAIAQFNRSRPLIPVAAGAILLVLAGHIRLLNVRTKSVAVPEKLPPGTYVARALEAARASRTPVDVAAVVPTVVPIGAHHPAPPVGDVARLPVWAEFEPASAMGLLDVSDEELEDTDRERERFARFAPFDQSGPEADIESQPETSPGAELESRLDVESESAFEAESAFESEFEAEAEDEDETESDSDLEDDDDEADLDAESESNVDLDDDEADLDAESDSESESELDEDAHAESELDSELDDDEAEVDFEAWSASDFEDEDEDEDDDEDEFEDDAEDEAAAEPAHAPAPQRTPVAVAALPPMPAPAAARARHPESDVPSTADSEEWSEPEFDPALLYAFESGSRAAATPKPAPETETDLEVLYAFDNESEWAEPEVFVSPRR